MDTRIRTLALASLTLALACWLLASCGGGAARGIAPAPDSGDQPNTAAPGVDPLQTALLAELDGTPAAGGKAFAVSSTEYALDGNQNRMMSRFGALVDQPELGSLTLQPAAGEVAFAGYVLEPRTNDYSGLAKRLRLQFTPVAGPDGPLPQSEYYIALADYTLGRWDWRGPFSGDVVVPFNTATERQRHFDLYGRVTVLIAVYGGDAGGASLGLRRVQFDTAGVNAPPVKPYKISLDPANIISDLPTWGFSGPPRAYNQVSYSAVGTVPFSRLGAEEIDVYRRDNADAGFTLVGRNVTFTGQGRGFHFSDPSGETGFILLPVPGVSYEYAVRLRNSVGETPLTGAIPVTTLLRELQWTEQAAELEDVVVELGWTGQLGLEGYELYRDGTLLAELPATEDWYVDSAVVPGEPHTYTVRSLHSTGFQETAPLETYANTPVPAITALTPSMAEISLEWFAPGYTALELYRNGELLAELPFDQTSYVDTSAEPATPYAYVVRGVYAAGHQDSAPAHGLRWLWEPYFLSYSGSKPYNRGQLADLEGRPAFLLGVQNASSDSQGMVSFQLLEADSPHPVAAEGWTLVEQQMPGVEPQPTAQGIGDPGGRENFAAVNGRPAVAMSSAWFSLADFYIALMLRGPQQAPPLPPQMLPWEQSWCPTGPVLDSLGVCEIGDRPALVWRDQFTLAVQYARALNAQPSGSADWEIGQVTTGTTTLPQMREVAGRPHMLARQTGALVYFRSSLVSPDGPQEWTRIQLGAYPAASALAQVDGRPAFVTADGTSLNYTAAGSAAPAVLGDFSTSLILGGIELTGDVRLVEYDGRPALTYHRIDGAATSAWLAVAASAAPAGPTDWTHYGLEAHSGMSDLVVTSGELLVVFGGGGPGRESGWYAVWPEGV